MQIFDPHALECLAAIVEEGSFERAAQRLSITQSAVSQRLRTLEMQAGAVLIVRTRPLKATPAGRYLLKHALQLRLLRADLGRDLQALAPRETQSTQGQERIAIAINADSIATWVLPALQTLVQDGMALEIITDDQDFTHEWLREGQVQACVTALAKPLRGCQVVQLGVMDYVAVASPDYADTHCPKGLTAHTLAEMRFMAFNRKDDLQTRFVRKACGLKNPGLQQNFLPSAHGRVRAALQGWGATVVPLLQVKDLLKSGALRDLAPKVRLPVALYWHCWKLESALLQALTAAVRSGAAKALKAQVA
jgi:LysR family transcriptional regulator (chromosome initiation inhibitor)